MTDHTLEKFWAFRPVRKVLAGEKELIFDSATKLSDYRAQTILTKEPGTVRWLNSLTEADVLYDIGANVGIYSVYAAAVRGARCFSFEPDSGNFALLCSNILLNNLSGRVIPYCMGALDRSGITTLHARKGAAGGSGHSVGYAVDSSLRPVKTGFEQGIYSIRIEDFAAREDGLPPTMIKIDVDGLEHLVVEGLGRLLNSPSLRGINIELSDKLVQHDHVRERLSASGFSVDEDLSFLHPNGSSRNLIFTRD